MDCFAGCDAPAGRGSTVAIAKNSAEKFPDGRDAGPVFHGTVRPAGKQSSLAGWEIAKDLRSRNANRTIRLENSSVFSRSQSRESRDHLEMPALEALPRL